MKIDQQVSILCHTFGKGVVAPTGWVDRQDELIENTQSGSQLCYFGHSYLSLHIQCTCRYD